MQHMSVRLGGHVTYHPRARLEQEQQALLTETILAQGLITEAVTAQLALDWVQITSCGDTDAILGRGSVVLWRIEDAAMRGAVCLAKLTTDGEIEAVHVPAPAAQAQLASDALRWPWDPSGQALARLERYASEVGVAPEHWEEVSAEART